MTNVEKVIRDGIKSERIERANKFLGAIREFDGKPATDRTAKLIGEKMGERVYLSTQYGMMHLKLESSPGNEHDYVDLLLAHQVTGVKIDSESIREKNTAYFSAAEDRNERREESLEKVELMEELQDQIDIANRAVARILELTMSHRAPFETDWVGIQKLLTFDPSARRK